MSDLFTGPSIPKAVGIFCAGLFVLAIKPSFAVFRQIASLVVPVETQYLSPDPASACYSQELFWQGHNRGCLTV